MVYSWKPNSRIKTSADVAGGVCESLEQSGGLTAKRLVDASRPEDAPLHNEFEWDDPKAAELYREHQAGHIIRSIVVKPEAATESVPIRAFFRVPECETSGYIHVAKIISDEDKLLELLSQAKKEMSTFANKYRSLSVLAPVIKEIDNIVERDKT